MFPNKAALSSVTSGTGWLRALGTSGGGCQSPGRLTSVRHQTPHPNQGSANMFCKETDGSIWGLCGPRAVFCYIFCFVFLPTFFKNIQTILTLRLCKRRPDVPRPPKPFLNSFATFGLWDSKKFFMTAPHRPGHLTSPRQSPAGTRTEVRWQRGI